MKIQAIILAALAFVAVSCNSGTEKTDKAATNSDIQYVSTSEGDFPLDNKGFPEQETVVALLDEMDYQKAVQTYLWAMAPIVTESMRNQAKYYGAKNNGDMIVMHNDPAVLGILTPNNVVEYMFGFNNYEQTGPMVLEMPGGQTVALMMDHQMRWSADLGLVSPNGPGPEKVLFLGPHDEVPKGLTNIDRVERINTNVGFLAIRVLDPIKDPDLKNTIKFYPYSERKDPKPINLFKAKQDDEIFYMGAPKGMLYWEQVHAYIQEEDVLEVDRFFMSHLEALGIEKGQPFNPTERQRNILERAVLTGEKMALSAAFHPKSKASHYRDDSNWSVILTLNHDHRTEFTSQFTERTDLFWEAFGVSPAMKSTSPGEGSGYLGSYKDKNNNWLDGSKNYSLVIAPDAPAAQFWDVTAYNLETRTILQNAGGETAINSFTENLVTNEDGSITLYFGPEIEESKKENWIQTNPEENWFAYLRLYGPTETYLDKSWPVYDIELVK